MIHESGLFGKQMCCKGVLKGDVSGGEGKVERLVFKRRRMILASFLVDS